MGKRTPLAGCIFCGNRPLTAEHVLAKWFTTSAGLGAPSRTRLFRDHELVHSGEQPSFSKKLRVVCKPCNEGWMKSLEDAVLPSLSEMVWGRSALLLTATQRLLATWFVKTCCVAEHLDITPGGHIPRVHYEQLYARQTLPPDWSQIWLGTSQVPKIGFGLQLTKWWCDRSAFKTGRSLGGIELGWTSTMRIGPVVLQASGCPTGELDLPRPEARGGLVQIWPVRRHVVSFPRAPYITMEQIKPPAARATGPGKDGMVADD